ncbi:terpene synthase-like isoform X2 [Epargyreus clarus]|uniref:terpene synthase-like isoform X2 n=1 Tax=Epargyreus clarus TaxID=520877 RepID=UPI003C2EC2F3
MSIFSSELDRVKQDEKVLKPFMHIQRAPNRYFLGFYQAFNYWLKVPQEKLQAIAEIMQILHSASLVFDDIHDGATIRYGVPVAHSVYSLALTLNSASHALAIALEKILALEHPQAVQYYSQAIVEAHRGQGIEIYWRDNLECPSEEEYIETSIVFILVFQFLQIFSENKTNYMKLMQLLGIYYQIRDDYCNLINQAGVDNLAMKTNVKLDNKDYCSDITEGKFSLPIIHALQHSDSADQILNILKQRTEDLHLKNQCISILEKAGSFRYTREILIELESKIYDEIECLGGNPMLTPIMHALGDWRDGDE